MGVNKRYFTSRDYINRDEWLDMWQDCIDDSSITQVDVRKVRSSEKGEMSAVLEVRNIVQKGMGCIIPNRFSRSFIKH